MYDYRVCLIYLPWMPSLARRSFLEADGVPSTIRMLNIVLVDTSISPDQRSPVPVSLLVRARFSVGKENDTVVKIRIIRPNGEETAIEKHPVKLENNGNFPEAPSGFNMALQFGLIPKNPGTCLIVVSVADLSVQVPITFVDRDRQNGQNPVNVSRRNARCDQHIQ